MREHNQKMTQELDDSPDFSSLFELKKQEKEEQEEHFRMMSRSSIKKELFY